MIHNYLSYQKKLKLGSRSSVSLRLKSGTLLVKYEYCYY